MPIWVVYAYKGVVYVPTTARLDSGAYMDIEPVESAPRGDRAAVARAVAAATQRQNPARPHPRPFPKPVMLAHARVRSWSEFERHAKVWNVEDRGGRFTLVPYKRAQPRGWVEDRDRAVTLRAGASLEEIADEVALVVSGSAGEGG